jgi:hypothetical protein
VSARRATAQGMPQRRRTPAAPPSEEQLARSAKARRSRVKGSIHERAVAAHLAELYPAARRGIGQTRAGGEVPDVTGTPWWVEAKNRKACNVHAAYAQALTARADAKSAALNNAPVLVVTRKVGETLDLVTMSMDDFKRLVRAWQEAEMR